MGHPGFASRTRTRHRNQIKHKLLGICILCSRKAEKGKTRCRYHLDYQNEKSKQYQKKLRR